jgi:single-strand DNA-binding protein
MSDLNKVMLIGRLGRDPEMKQTANGMAITKFALATGRKVKKGDVYEDETEWHNVVCFGKTAEFVERYLTKGRQVFVEGRNSTSSYQKEGEATKRYSTDVIADRVDFLDKAPEGSAQGGGAPAPKSTPKQGGFGDPDSFNGTDDDIPF